MKTVGERVRQAREFRGLTGEQLAERAGYKNQSAIGNLENRGSGRGGFRLPKIAHVLGFPVQWFLEGPDYENLEDLVRELRSRGERPAAAGADRQEHMAQLLDQLTEEGAARAVEYLELLQFKFARDDPTDEAALAKATVRRNTQANRLRKRA